MKNIRHSVFETNSSSSHSLSISEDSDGVLDTIIPDDTGSITLTGGEFGWGYESYNDPMSKANYLAVFADKNADMTEMLIKVLKSHTGAKSIIFDFSTEDYNHINYSYIDHQSSMNEGGDGLRAFKSMKVMKDFIFNPKSELIIDNDNR